MNVISVLQVQISTFRCKSHLCKYPQALSYKPAFLTKTRWKTNFGITMQLCVTAEQHFFFKQPRITSSGPDSEEMQKGKILLKTGKQGISLCHEGHSGWSDGGCPVEGLLCHSSALPAHSLSLTKTGTVSYSWLGEGCLWRVTMPQFMRDIPKTLSGRWFTIIKVLTADSSRKEHLMSNRQLLM